VPDRNPDILGHAGLAKDVILAMGAGELEITLFSISRTAS